METFAGCDVQFQRLLDERGEITRRLQELIETA